MSLNLRKYGQRQQWRIEVQVPAGQFTGGERTRFKFTGDEMESVLNHIQQVVTRWNGRLQHQGWARGRPGDPDIFIQMCFFKDEEDWLHASENLKAFFVEYNLQAFVDRWGYEDVEKTDVDEFGKTYEWTDPLALPFKETWVSPALEEEY